MQRLGALVEAEARMYFVVKVGVVVEAEVESGLPLRGEKEALKAEVVEVEARDLLVGKLEEAVAVVEQDSMRRLYGDLVEAAHVELKAQSFLVLREVVEQVQGVEVVVAPRESEKVC
jgi:hypothetical protein